MRQRRGGRTLTTAEPFPEKAISRVMTWTLPLGPSPDITAEGLGSNTWTFAGHPNSSVFLSCFCKLYLWSTVGAQQGIQRPGGICLANQTLYSMRQSGGGRSPLCAPGPFYHDLNLQKETLGYIGPYRWVSSAFSVSPGNRTLVAQCGQMTRKAGGSCCFQG